MLKEDDSKNRVNKNNQGQRHREGVVLLVVVFVLRVHAP